MTLLLAQLGERFWMPDAASTVADDVDWLFYFLYWVSVGAATLILATMILFVIRYRRRPGHKARPSPSHSTALELTWSIIPTLVFLLMFWWGFQGFIEMHTPRGDAYHVTVESRMWSWSFRYPNGVTNPETLVVPVNRPIKLDLVSYDVIHSFYVPAFRIKQDLVPDRTNSIWFEATEIGEYDLYCAEYCGQDHSEMVGTVKVVSEADFREWLEEQAVDPDAPPHEQGKRIYDSLGCIACHSIDGTPGTGPSLKDIYGYEREMTDGRVIEADANYLRQQILNPRAQTVAGYPAGRMISYQGQLDEEQLNHLIAYIRTLSDRGPSPEDLEQKYEEGEDLEHEIDDDPEDIEDEDIELDAVEEVEDEEDVDETPED